MANSKTSLNGYEYGRSPKTTAPFWGESGEGAEIDDTGVYTDKTWSSQKISDELAEKAEASELASYAKVTSVYTKSESYSKAEVDALIDEIPAVDAYTKTETDELLADKADADDVYTKTETDNLLANKAGVNSVYTKGQTDRLLTDKANAADVYTKSQTDGLLSDKADVTDLVNYAKVTSVYTKTETYTKAEVDALVQGGGTPVDSYTKAQTDALLDEKANAADVYSKTQTDNLLADKANASSVYTKTQTDNLLADKANSSDVYSKSQTYTKTEVDDLISQSGGGGAEIDDTTSAADKVWSSEKTRASLLKSAGLYLSNGVPQTWVALIRQKTSGSATSTRNAMTEQFSADYQYSLSGGTVTVTIMYENGGAGQSYTINLTDIPWNDVANADYSTNYPSDNSRWKTIVASEDIFEICIGGNVSGSSGYYYPYIFVRVPKGTYASSISLSANLGNNKWTKAGSVAVINGYATDPTVPLFTKDITSMVNDSRSAFSILDSVFYDDIIPTFKRDIDTIMKFNKMVIECTKVDFNGNTIKFKSNWNIKNIKVARPYSSSSNMSFSSFILEYDRYDGNKWVFNYPAGMTKISYNISGSNANITGSKVDDSTTTLDVVLFGQSDYYDTWTLKFYQ